MREEKCDFCIVAKNPRWTYPTNRFTLPPDARLPGYQDDGRWGACDDCAEYIEHDDELGLFRRCTKTVPDQSELGALWLVKLLRGFFANRSGPRYLE